MMVADWRSGVILVDVRRERASCFEASSLKILMDLSRIAAMKDSRKVVMSSLVKWSLAMNRAVAVIFARAPLLTPVAMAASIRPLSQMYSRDDVGLREWAWPGVLHVQGPEKGVVEARMVKEDTPHDGHLEFILVVGARLPHLQIVAAWSVRTSWGTIILILKKVSHV